MKCDSGMIKLWENGGDAACFNEDLLLFAGLIIFIIVMALLNKWS